MSYQCPKIAVIQFPGSNCERESALALQRVGMEPVHIFWHDKNDLSAFDGVVIVGGFSYEDRGRAGLIAAFEPMMAAIKAQADLGKPILGICNGAQILVESGLVPGLADYKLGMALAENRRVQDGQVLGVGYYNSWCHIKAQSVRPQSVFARYADKPLHIPLAHGEGRFIIPEAVWQTLQQSEAPLWQYCDQTGEVKDSFPTNPNGSDYSLAGVGNVSGNVLALMPHPERTAEGDAIFQSMRDFIVTTGQVATSKVKVELNYPPINQYTCPAGSSQLIIGSIIQDNAAMSMQKLMQQQGLAVSVKRFKHWQLEDISNDELSGLKNCPELFNPNKEYLLTELTTDDNVLSYLVRNIDDNLGQHKQQLLASQGIASKNLQSGILWQITISADSKLSAEQLHDQITTQNLLANPWSQVIMVAT